jgi:prepilin-type N-terminal cleavage/methylation domain-containing protein
MSRSTKQKGFSVIEVVVSLFMLGVILLVYAAANNTLILNRIAKHQQLAYRIAANELESIRALPYASIPSSGPFSDTLMTNLPSGSGALATSVYDSRTKQIVVTVTWREPGTSIDKTESVTTLITEGGLGQ